METYSLQFTSVQGDWKTVLLFTRYVNPGGKGANGQCCDGKWRVCQKGGCDHMFTICLDNTRR